MPGFMLQQDDSVDLAPALSDIEQTLSMLPLETIATKPHIERQERYLTEWLNSLLPSDEQFCWRRAMQMVNKTCHDISHAHLARLEQSELLDIKVDEILVKSLQNISESWLRIASHSIIGQDYGVFELRDAFLLVRNTEAIGAFVCSLFQIVLLLNQTARDNSPLEWPVYTDATISFKDILGALADAFLCGEGDIWRHISYIVGESLIPYCTCPLDGFQWQIEKLGTSVRDGLRLGCIADRNALVRLACSSSLERFDMVYSQLGISAQEFPIADIINGVQSTTLRLLWRIRVIWQNRKLEPLLNDEIRLLGFVPDAKDPVLQWIRYANMAFGKYVGTHIEALADPIVTVNILSKYGVPASTSQEQLSLIGFPENLKLVETVCIDHCRVYFGTLFDLITLQRDWIKQIPILSNMLWRIFRRFVDCSHVQHAILAKGTIVTTWKYNKAQTQLYQYFRLSALCASHYRRYSAILRHVRIKIASSELCLLVRGILARIRFNSLKSHRYSRSARTIFQLWLACKCRLQFKFTTSSSALISTVYKRFRDQARLATYQYSSTAIQSIFRCLFITARFNRFESSTLLLCTVWAMSRERKIVYGFISASQKSIVIMAHYRAYQCRLKVSQTRQQNAERRIKFIVSIFRQSLYLQKFRQAKVLNQRIIGCYKIWKAQSVLNSLFAVCLIAATFRQFLTKKASMQKLEQNALTSKARLSLTQINGKSISQITTGCQNLSTILRVSKECIDELDIEKLAQRLIDLLSNGNQSLPYVAMAKQATALLLYVPIEFRLIHREALIDSMLTHKGTPDLLIDLSALLPSNVLEDLSHRKLAVLCAYCKKKSKLAITVKLRDGSTVSQGELYHQCHGIFSRWTRSLHS